MAPGAGGAKATSHSHTAFAGECGHRNMVVRRTFPGFAAGKSAVDPVLRRSMIKPRRAKRDEAQI